MSQLKMRVVSKTMQCIVRANPENGMLELLPEFQVSGSKVTEVRKIDSGAIPMVLIKEISEANLKQFNLKLRVHKLKLGDKINCEVLYMARDETPE